MLLPKATLHRILATLMREGLLRHDPYTKTYRLGFRLLELAHEVWSDFDLRLAGQDEMVRLRNALAETVFLAVLDGDSVVLVASEEAGRDTGLKSTVGVRLPVHATAAGKAILAYMDPARQMELLKTLPREAFTTATLTGIDALRSELDLTRARGYAIEHMEHAQDVVSVAAPIFDIEGRPIGAVCISSRADRMNEARAHHLSSNLIGSALFTQQSKRQGGLLDLLLDADFERNRTLFFCFSEPGPGGNSTALARARRPRCPSDGVALIRRSAPR